MPGNPRPLLWTVSLPVHKVLPATTALADVQDAPDRERWITINRPGWRTNSDSRIGYTRETWKVGCILREPGSQRCTASAFTIRSTSKGRTNLDANFSDSTWSGTLRRQPNLLACAIAWSWNPVCLPLGLQGRAHQGGATLSPHAPAAALVHRMDGTATSPS